MSFGDPNNPYGQQPPQAPYGAPQQPPGVPPQGGQPGYGYPQQPAPPQQPYGAPQQPAQYGYPQQQAAPGYGYPGQPGMPGMPMAYASWGARLGARLLDGLIIMVIPGILYGIAFAVAMSNVKTCAYDDYSCRADAGPPVFAFLLMGLAGLLVLAGGIFLIAKEGSTGQTPGKKALGIRVVRDGTGAVPGFGTSFGRQACHYFLGGMCGLNFLWPLWDEKSQTWSDKICGTIVVRAQ
ncbi:RDD family protein [Streptomyces sp. NPDC101227]|uniref:RDD family protein n=1 Tax=Streptomyces sp. NPDC101227 TaxID=3366136 RepID=UPI003819BA85